MAWYNYDSESKTEDNWKSRANHSPKFVSFCERSNQRTTLRIWKANICAKKVINCRISYISTLEKFPENKENKDREEELRKISKIKKRAAPFVFA